MEPSKLTEEEMNGDIEKMPLDEVRELYFKLVLAVNAVYEKHTFYPPATAEDAEPTPRISATEEYFAEIMPLIKRQKELGILFTKLYERACSWEGDGR